MASGGESDVGVRTGGSVLAGLREKFITISCLCFFVGVEFVSVQSRLTVFTASYLIIRVDVLTMVVLDARSGDSSHVDGSNQFLLAFRCVRGRRINIHRRGKNL